LILWYLIKSRKGEPDDDAPDELDEAIASAKRRIAKARPGGVKSLNDLPVIFFLGQSGSTKTTILSQSGLEPNLLAGQVHQGDVIVPTGAVNIWYGNKTVFVEVGGMLLQDADRVTRMVKQLRPRRLLAAVTGRPLPPRIAVVCVSCDELQGMRATANAGAANGGQGAGASALVLQDRIRRISSGLGIRLPVYALVTKTDLVPRFTDFVRNLKSDEAAGAMGATLRLPPVGATGVYAEQESQRLSAACNAVFNSLSIKRLDLLSREANLEERSGAYEFPREMLKLFPALTQYLIELCRPTDLDVSPILRGFYFTGVRPVIVGQQPEIARPQTGAAAAGGAVGATMLFDPGEGDFRLQPEAAPTGQRRVPQWVFLKRFFSDVLLQDRVARGISEGGIRVSRLRRLGLACASALGVLLLFGLLV
jgi:type VI secretion system protein ImpL